LIKKSTILSLSLEKMFLSGGVLSILCAMVQEIIKSRRSECLSSLSKQTTLNFPGTSINQFCERSSSCLIACNNLHYFALF
jgi:hypothetical protein